jgi:hypothetical protein
MGLIGGLVGRAMQEPTPVAPAEIFVSCTVTDADAKDRAAIQKQLDKLKLGTATMWWQQGNVVTFSIPQPTVHGRYDRATRTVFIDKE